MRLVTGNDRAVWENLVSQNARLLARLEALEAEIQKACEREKAWEERWRHANARAERAVDAQLAVRGFPTVTPREGMPDLPDDLAEDPEEAAKIEQRMLAGDPNVFMERR